MHVRRYKIEEIDANGCLPGHGDNTKKILARDVLKTLQIYAPAGHYSSIAPVSTVNDFNDLAEEFTSFTVGMPCECLSAVREVSLLEVWQDGQ